MDMRHLHETELGGQDDRRWICKFYHHTFVFVLPLTMCYKCKHNYRIKYCSNLEVVAVLIDGVLVGAVSR